MNRRAILAILSGGAASLCFRFGWAKDGDRGPSTSAQSSPGLNRTGATDISGAGAKLGFPDLKLVGRDRQVRSIAYSRGAYRVTTADGSSTEFLETDLRFKVDSSELGPQAGTPIIMPAGTEGDRVWVFFASPNEISGSIDYDWL